MFLLFFIIIILFSPSQSFKFVFLILLQCGGSCLLIILDCLMMYRLMLMKIVCVFIKFVYFVRIVFLLPFHFFFSRCVVFFQLGFLIKRKIFFVLDNFFFFSFFAFKRSYFWFKQGQFCFLFLFLFVHLIDSQLSFVLH